MQMWYFKVVLVGVRDCGGRCTDSVCPNREHGGVRHGKEAVHQSRDFIVSRLLVRKWFNGASFGFARRQGRLGFGRKLLLWMTVPGRLGTGRGFGRRHLYGIAFDRGDLDRVSGGAVGMRRPRSRPLLTRAIFAGTVRQRMYFHLFLLAA